MIEVATYKIRTEVGKILVEADTDNIYLVIEDKYNLSYHLTKIMAYLGADDSASKDGLLFLVFSRQWYNRNNIMPHIKRMVQYFKFEYKKFRIYYKKTNINKLQLLLDL